MNSKIDRAEFTNLERLQKLVEASDLDAVLATSLENITYTSGFYELSMGILTEIMHVVIWPAEGEPIFIVDHLRSEAETFIGEVREYDRYIRDEIIEDQRGRSLVSRSPVPLLAEVLREKGLTTGRIGLEKMHFPLRCYEELHELMPSAEFVDCGSLFDEARMIKTPAEIELLRSGGIATEKAIQIGFVSAQPGDTIRSVAHSISSALGKLGADGVAFLQCDVMSGGKMFEYLGREPVELKEGDVLRVDVGGYFGGYYSDVARMAVVGEPTPEQRSTYRRLHGVQRKMIEEIMKPGRLGTELFQLTSKAFEEFGFPMHWGILSHGIGLSIHERPWLKKSETYELQPGMVLAVEPIKRGPGDLWREEMWHIEDLILITEEGARELTTYSSTDELYIIE